MTVHRFRKVIGFFRHRSQLGLALVTVAGATGVGYLAERWFGAVLGFLTGISLSLGLLVVLQRAQAYALKLHRSQNPGFAAAEERSTTGARVDGELNTTRDRIEEIRVPAGGPRLPLVSVVLTAHNEAHYIGHAIDSILEQSWPSWECVIVDDGSTDDTAEITRRVTGEDVRFTLLRNERARGLAAARNQALEQAEGEFITFLDGDDYLYTDAISDRMGSIARSDRPSTWVLGAFCGWHSVPEAAARAPTGPNVMNRKPVSWMDLATGAPFIASAPLIRTERARAVGGFDPRNVTAEDYDFWERLLRAGGVIESSAGTGIAYRQKHSSMFRMTAGDHRDITLRVARRMTEPSSNAVDFVEPVQEARLRILEIERQLIALVSAVAHQDEPSIGQITDHLGLPGARSRLGYVDLTDFIHRAVTRHLRYSEAELGYRRTALSASVYDTLQRSGVLPLPPGPLAMPLKDSPLRLPAESPRRWLPTRLTKPTHPVVLLAPNASYHVAEMGPIADQLRELGHRPMFYVIPSRRDWVFGELGFYDVPVFSGAADELADASVSAFITTNDWGDNRSEVELLKAVGIPTFGKVEGVQDFEDTDVHWERRPYQRVDYVLAQGINDVVAVGKERSKIVGNVRLERIWQESMTRPVAPLAVVNLNFTYHVLEEHRALWIESVIEAMQQSQMPFVISLHHAEIDRDYPNISDDPMRHLLTKASILISRFSTVPFEAMARGVPFVYHNPHAEKVSTFQHPNGAFPITKTVGELVEAVQAAQSVVNYRAIASDFFQNQIDISDVPADLRAAMMVHEAIQQG